MNNNANRRPLAVRSWKITQGIAHWLSQRKITPNQISILSIVFAAFTAFCLVRMPDASGSSPLVYSCMALLGILGRASCNIFDGMVAIEGGKSTRSGELFNDIPDRIADPLIIVAAGYASTVVSWSSDLGWLAGLLAVMTAYVRTLARSIGAPTDFRGPMSKVPRMILIAAACLLAPFEHLFWPRGTAFFIALLLISAGCVVTIWNRAYAAYLFLEKDKNA